MSRIPLIEQLTANECGPACLAMVLGHYGKHVTLDEVRRVADTGREGSTARTLLEGAELFGLVGHGVKIEVDQLAQLPRASILHWEFNHFVVLDRVHRQSVEILDPGSGRRHVPMDRFSASFTGVALILEPAPGFKTQPKRKSLIGRYLRRVLSHPGHWRRILLTSALLQLLALAVPALTGALVDRVLPRGDWHLLSILALGLLGVVGFQFLSSLIRAHLLLDLRTRVDARGTAEFLEHLLGLPYSFFQERPAGDLILRLNSNSTIREVLTTGVLSGTLDAVLFSLYLVLLLVASPWMALTAGILGSFQLLAFLVTRRRQRDLMSQDLAAQSKAESYQMEIFSGIETLKAMGSEESVMQRWNVLFIDTLNVASARGRLGAWVDAWTGTLVVASPLCLLAVGAWLVLHGDLSVGAMLALDAVAVGFLTPIGTLVGIASQLQLMGSYLDRLQEVLIMPPEQDPASVRPAGVLSGQIEVQNVQFAYGARSPPVLRDVSLSIKPGQFVAIVGRSGSGKSSLARILLGLYPPHAGKVLYDGQDLAQLEAHSVRRQLGIVTQHAHLFAGSIRANITLADPDADLDQVIEAAKLAQIHDDIAAMPLGYETVLADAGASLAGGQRQRLALARALLRKPTILLLDEATSALDTISEQLVQSALAQLRCTRVVIAHRLSTVAAAELILAMEDGRIVEQGRHEELLARNGAYAALVRAQLGAGSVTQAGE